MKVRELVEILKTMPQLAEVLNGDHEPIAGEVFVVDAAGNSAVVIE